MSRPKLTTTAEELEKLFRVYPEIVPAYGWVQRNQDRLTAPIHVEEFEREDNAGTTLVPMFVVDNDDDRRMLYSNLREGKNYVINILQTAPLNGHDDLDGGGDSNLNRPGDSVSVHRCSYSRCRVTDSSMTLEMCNFCRKKCIHRCCFLNHIAKTEYVQKYNYEIHPEHVFCSKNC